jgi:hypothetical protein
VINALDSSAEAAWRELDGEDQAAAAIPALVPLGTQSPDMVRLVAEVKQITHAIGWPPATPKPRSPAPWTATTPAPPTTPTP